MMRKSHQSPVLRELQGLFSVGTHAGLTDGELLARFTSRQGGAAELAFAALVERHGPMVFRVCRRALVDPHTTEDAFQATFLILARKATTLRDRGSVGNWLYGVASRVAAKARTASARRLSHEQRYANRVKAVQTSEDDDQTDLATLVHEEVGRLPDRYRIPIVLCYLEGSTQEEAAVRLGWPIGTVRSRLARARERLRCRLTLRGVVPTTAGLVAALAADVSAAPQGLVDSTVRAAMEFAAVRAVAAGTVSASVDALTLGVLRTMLMTKLKTAAAVVLALGTATGAGVLATQDEPRDTGGAAPARTTPASPGKSSSPKSADRSAKVSEYLERTKQEVDSTLTDLEAEVADLRARLKQAEENLRRMQSLQAALGDPAADAGANGPMSMMMQGMMGGSGKVGGGNSQSSGMSGMPGMMGGRGYGGGMMSGMMGGFGGSSGSAGKGTRARSAEATKSAERSSSAAPKGIDRRVSETPSGAEDATSRARRLEALDQEIRRLTEERERLDDSGRRR